MAYSYTSYLIRQKNIISKINGIFLFGSVSRGDFDDDSDIDIFIDTNDESIVKKASIITLKTFYSLEGKKWEYKGVKNKLSVKVGKLEEWDLKDSVEKEGIILYSQSSPKLKKFLLFKISTIRDSAKRVKVMRKIFGRKEKNYSEPGLTDKYPGEKISPSAFIISSEGMHEAASLLTKEKAEFSFKEIWM